jgi:hypothetical protein
MPQITLRKCLATLRPMVYPPAPFVKGNRVFLVNFLPSIWPREEMGSGP